MPTLRRRERTSRSQISRPSRKTVAEGGSQRRFKALRSVDLPLPLGPMTPTITPFGMSTLMPFSMGTPASETLFRFRISNLGWAWPPPLAWPSTSSRCSLHSSVKETKHTHTHTQSEKYKHGEVKGVLRLKLYLIEKT